MDESFEITVAHEGREVTVPIILAPYGYTYRLRATIGDTEIIYEPDEEMGYRVMAGDGAADKLTSSERELIRLTGEQLNTLRS